jgi:hypothetical protein
MLVLLTLAGILLFKPEILAVTFLPVLIGAIIGTVRYLRARK